MRWWKQVSWLLLVVVGVVGMAGAVDACSSFAVFASDEVIYGSNLDWNDASEAKFSIRDGRGEIKYFLLQYRLLGAFRGTMGMNNQGVLAAVHAVPPIDATQIPLTESRIYISDLFDWVLMNAQTVSDVVEFVEGQTVQPPPGIYLHLHVADRFGNAVVIEGDQDGTKVLPAGEEYSLMTNFYANRYIEEETKPCPRYQIADAVLQEKAEQFGRDDAFDLLDQIHQYSTRVSMVYFPERNQIQLVLGAEYEKVWLVDLTEETLQTYQGFAEEKSFHLPYSGVTSSEMGFTFPTVVKSEIRYEIDPEEYQSYIGDYEVTENWRFQAEVFIEDGMLYLEMQGLTFLLVPKDDDTFTVDLVFADVTFVRDEQGEVTGFVFDNIVTRAEFEKF